MTKKKAALVLVIMILAVGSSAWLAVTRTRIEEQNHFRNHLQGDTFDIAKAAVFASALPDSDAKRKLVSLVEEARKGLESESGKLDARAPALWEFYVADGILLLTACLGGGLLRSGRRDSVDSKAS